MKSLLPFALALSTLPAHALDGAAGDVSWELNNKLSAGAAVRTQSRDPRLIGIANGGRAYSTNSDDGDLAFKPGDVVGAALKLTSDLKLSYENYGVFARGSYLFDPVLSQRNYFDAGDYGSGREYSLAERDRKNRQVRRAVGNDADLLDFYGFASFDVGEHSVSLRLGKQVLNWGESTFILNGINSVAAFDANALHVPGFDLQELTVPAGMAWGSVTLTPEVSVQAFYQFDWQPTRTEAAGTFWTTNDFDFVGLGGNAANLGFGLANENALAGSTCANGTSCVPLGSTVPRAHQRRPSDNGQFGGALHWYLPELNDTDLGFYAMNYHSRLPVVSGHSRNGPGPTPASTADYFLEYPENIQLYGTSFSTSIGSYALQGEYSFKHDQPLQLDDVEVLLTQLGLPSQINSAPGAALGHQYVRGWRRHDVSQLDLSVTRVLGPLAWIGSDQLVLLGEAAAMYVHDLPPWSKMRYEAPATYTPGDAATAAGQGVPQQKGGYATPFSWGYRIAARLAYNNLLGPVGLEPQLLFSHDVNGTSPLPLNDFVDGSMSVTTLVGFKFPSQFHADVGYVSYFGGGAHNLLTDRDFAVVDVSYSF